MPSYAALLAALFIASATTAFAAPVRRAGEWQTVTDNGEPEIACLRVDATLDQKSVRRGVARLPGVSCRMQAMTNVGRITSIAVQCTQPGVGVMTLTGTTVTTGADAFTSTMQSHADYYGPDTEKRLAVPYATMTSVSRRLGPCKPGDRLTETVDPY